MKWSARGSAAGGVNRRPQTPAELRGGSALGAPRRRAVAADGAASVSALGASVGPFGLYIHGEYCAVRCGYCDFNTYLTSEVGSGGDPQSWHDGALEEIRLARRVSGLKRRARHGFFGWEPRRSWRVVLASLVEAA